MTNKVLLNNIDHHDLRLRPGYHAGFGDAVNQMLVFPTEFEEAQRDFPILFRRNDAGGVQAVVLLGLDRDENLFLGPTGWTTRYVPALQRRGPFSIVMTPAADDPDRREPMIHVDLDDRRIGRDEGVPLFLPQGGNAPALERVSATLRTIYVGMEMAQPLYAAWDAHGLLEPVELDVALDEERHYAVPGVHAVVEHRLAALPGAALEALNRAGFLRPAMLASASLGNVHRLIDLKRRRDGA
ncbi:SapC family protein [Sphingomonas sanxanigenens]|uniref:Peptide ABC transporter permease n=1 Tax=Sphingomonas sanxanigenens DSM 19645 = NX02 TaxID=1123269 RepID=W0ALV1_9SPHN|nr:SapC family protein [Sphingomonas sanxanigenens]AHE57318.1 hypothetical protein NX02_28695 [Sphingomonas sanxanigenens DSM 19645 = NX02]